MIREPALPARWAFLLDDHGQLDRYRWSCFRLSLGMTVHAICAGNPPSSDIVIVAECDNVFALVTDMPIRQVHGPALSDAGLAVVAAFMDQNRSVLHAHWSGKLDSIGLAKRLFYNI